LAVELPGLEENDIEVLLEDGILTLRGEEKSEDRDAQANTERIAINSK